MNGDGTGEALPQPPFEPLRDKLLELVGELRRGGGEAAATELERTIAAWWTDQQHWNGLLCQRLRMYHEINNALVGVRGNAQLLLMGPLGSEPDARARLEVVIRESSRIKEVAGTLREIRTRIQGSADGRHVA